MPKFKVEWYIDYAGSNGIRELEIEDAKDEEDAIEQTVNILFSHITLGEVNEVK